MEVSSKAVAAQVVATGMIGDCVCLLFEVRATGTRTKLWSFILPIGGA